MGFSTPETQLEFWQAFSSFLADSGFKTCEPTTRNFIYLPAGTRYATIVLVAPTGSGGISCKLHLKGSRSSGVAHSIYRDLRNERGAIEAELGFRVDWGLQGTGQSSTRIYRNRPKNIENRGDWPEAFGWLMDTAKTFRHVFAPRIDRIAISATRS